ncbi:MAG: type II toxin-antitoxin system RelE/ParE family toxin [Streptococcaceae bacterium]|nr:type II toxin-antitoxin system RelE/ParE family toxin [Streptococcaceae bacterium]
MSKEVEFSIEAQEDLARLEAFLITQASSRVLQRFKQEFLRAAAMLSDELTEFPYVEGKEPLRKMIHWKYLYFHLELADRVTVVRIFSKKEDWVNELQLAD